MVTQDKIIEEFANREYEHGFVTDVEQETLPPGLDEDVIRFISAKKDEPEWLLEWRLKAYRHWLELSEPRWPNVSYPEIDYKAISYFAAPKKAELESLDEVDPEILSTYEKLGIPLEEQKILAGVAVDAVFDSVSVATTFKEKLGELGIIFCSFSEAVREHPELVKKYLGSVVPTTDNFFATLELGGLLRRLLRLHPQGRALPDGALDLFSDQRRQHRPVRAHPDRRRRGRLRQLSRGLHRADARREPAPRGGGRTGRPRGCDRSSTRRCRTGIPATRRTARAGSTTSSPNGASARATRRSPGPRSRPARRSPGSIRAVI